MPQNARDRCCFRGWGVSGYEIPFKHRNLGIVTPQVLADSYAICDMCLVISNTNLSISTVLRLWPATRSPVCSKGANSSWMVNEENSILVDYDPIQIADRMEYYFNHPDELATIRKKGMDFVKGTSWYKEAEKVYASMLKGIEEDEKKLQ